MAFCLAEQEAFFSTQILRGYRISGAHWPCSGFCRTRRSEDVVLVRRIERSPLSTLSLRANRRRTNFAPKPFLIMPQGPCLVDPHAPLAEYLLYLAFQGGTRLGPQAF
jgi:hypothetical protein